jgi:hypothetical protein
VDARQVSFVSALDAAGDGCLLQLVKEGWAQIPGPNSLYGRLAAMRGEPIPQFPPALNIEWLLTKW